MQEKKQKAIKTKLIEDSHRHLNISHKLASQIEVEKVEDETLALELKVGDRVKYRNTKGNILSIKGSKAFIQNDEGFKMQVLLTDLRRSGNPPPKPKKKVSVNITNHKVGI